LLRLRLSIVDDDVAVVAGVEVCDVVFNDVIRTVAVVVLLVDVVDMVYAFAIFVVDFFL